MALSLHFQQALGNPKLFNFSTGIGLVADAIFDAPVFYSVLHVPELGSFLRAANDFV